MCERKEIKGRGQTNFFLIQYRKSGEEERGIDKKIKRKRKEGRSCKGTVLHGHKISGS